VRHWPDFRRSLELVEPGLAPRQLWIGPQALVATACSRGGERVWAMLIEGVGRPALTLISLDRRGTVLAWLCTMAHRRAVDRIRQSQRERVRDEQYELRQAGPPSDETWGEVEQSLDTEEVRTGLGSLSELQREAVCLVYYRGYSHRQVAEHLAVPLGTAKARIRDGLNNLRSALGVQR
jgi:RNA polymerase sigma factor (sigma-70 family)